MSPQEIKEFCKTPKGKLLIVCGVLLVFSWIFIIFQFVGGTGDLFPTPEKNNQLKQDLRKLRAEVAKRREKAEANRLLRKRYQDQLSSYWNEERDGLVDTVLRNRVQAVAKELDLTLMALGSVRTTRINQELYYAEVDNVSFIASYDMVLKFLRRLSKEQPRIYWRRLNLRMIPVRQQRQQMERNRSSSESKDTPITPATLQMRFHGALRVIGFDGKLPAKGKGKGKLSPGKKMMPLEKKADKAPAKNNVSTDKEKKVSAPAPVAGKGAGKEEVRGTPLRNRNGKTIQVSPAPGEKGAVKK